MSTVHPAVPDRGIVPYQWIANPLSALSFYSAIVMPVVYLGLLMTGIETTDGLALFLGLFGLHVASLVGGRSYRVD